MAAMTGRPATAGAQAMLTARRANTTGGLRPTGATGTGTLISPIAKAAGQVSTAPVMRSGLAEGGAGRAKPATGGHIAQVASRPGPGATPPRVPGRSGAGGGNGGLLWSPQDIQALIAKYTGGVGAPMSEGQIQSAAQSQIDPIIAAITASITGQTKNASDQIAANAGALAKQFASTDFGAPYKQAEQSQSAIDSALQQSLDGQGSSLAQDLSSRLGMIADPTVGAASTGLADRGTAIGTNQLAAGSAELGQLVANAAAAGEYGAKQPGIVQSQGLQDIANMETQANSTLGAETLKAEEQLPSIVSSLRSSSDANARSRASLASGLFKTLTGQNIDAAKFNEKTANDQFNQNYKINDFNLQAKKFNEKTANDQFNQNYKINDFNLQAKKFAQQTLNENRGFQVSLARLGIENKRYQLSAAAQEFKLANGGFSSTALARYNGLLQQGIDSMPAGTTYEQYVAKSVEHGVPLSLAIQKANTHWVPTQRPPAQDLANVLGISQQAASALAGSGAQKAAYDQMVGMPDKAGRVELATGPQGQKVMLQMPKTVTPALRTILGGAVKYLGTPYAWGGESPKGFDCSGLAQYLYKEAGVDIPRTTYDQFQAGSAVSKRQLQAGDLVFFKGSDAKMVGGQLLPGHVGIYLGAGQFIEAPHSGSVVKVSKLTGYPGFMGGRHYGG